AGEDFDRRTYGRRRGRGGKIRKRQVADDHAGIVVTAHGLGSSEIGPAGRRLVWGGILILECGPLKFQVPWGSVLRSPALAAVGTRFSENVEEAADLISAIRLGNNAGLAVRGQGWTFTHPQVRRQIAARKIQLKHFRVVNNPRPGVWSGRWRAGIDLPQGESHLRRNSCRTEALAAVG